MKFVAGFGDLALEKLTFVIDGTSEIMYLAVDLDNHLVEMPSPLSETPHATYPPSSYVPCK